jgi:hypothetical protein
MARKSKGFGELLGLQKQSQTSSQARQEQKKGLPSLKIVSPDEREPAKPSKFEQQERRIGEIIGVDEDGEVFEVNDKTLATYQNYLKQYLQFPVTLTGIEDFHWEEYYIIGPGPKKEHEKLRKTRPSYLDTYDLLEFKDKIDSWTGLEISVRRLEDSKKFVLPLGDLKATDENSKNYQLINDYVTWFVNWR